MLADVEETTTFSAGNRRGTGKDPAPAHGRGGVRPGCVTGRLTRLGIDQAHERFCVLERTKAFDDRERFACDWSCVRGAALAEERLGEDRERVRLVRARRKEVVGRLPCFALGTEEIAGAKTYRRERGAREAAEHLVRAREQIGRSLRFAARLFDRGASRGERERENDARGGVDIVEPTSAVFSRSARIWRSASSGRPSLSVA